MGGGGGMKGGKEKEKERADKRSIAFCLRFGTIHAAATNSEKWSWKPRRTRDNVRVDLSAPGRTGTVDTGFRAERAGLRSFVSVLNGYQ